MNLCVLIGRLTRDPEIRQAQTGSSVANFTLAVDRRFKRDGQPDADFFNCSAFGKTAEFVEKYLKKGTKVVVRGSIQNNNYKDKNGVDHYTTQIAVDELEFAESKNAAQQNGDMPQTQAQPTPASSPDDGFMNVPEGIEADLPFARI